jgi:hypothetical protein
LISVSEYARRRGVTHPAVFKAIKDGRLLKSVSRDARSRPHIDPVLADQEWARNTDEAQQRPREQQRKAEAPIGQQALFGDVGNTKRNELDEQNSKAASAWRVNRALREAAEAQLKTLELRERQRELVVGADVSTAAFETGRALREAILNVPNLISAELARTSDSHAVHEILTRALIRALASIADGLSTDRR